MDEMFEEIVTLLTLKNKLGYLNDINRMLLQELVLFLSELQSATLDLEQFKKPTLHKAAYWRHVLLTHLKPVEMKVKDHEGNILVAKHSNSIIALKAIMLSIFDEKFKLQEIQISATVLDPIMKSKLRGMCVDGFQFNHAIESLRAKMISLPIEETTSNDEQLWQNEGAALTRT